MRSPVYGYGFRQHPKQPGPEFRLLFSCPEDPNERIVVDAIIDSAAVRSTIPRNAVEAIGRHRLITERTSARDFNNQRVPVLAHVLDVSFGQRPFPGLTVIESARDYALIGRDILNSYYVHLNAPDMSWAVDPPCEVTTP